ncbi:hypothetical protein EGT36_21310 [Agrobacterium sp. FDAARGOS_525]|uniref:hypothetical protein n=1 Tax=Agrobacterium sp. FDAARGOS_525 TaxID=2420311 RepID=UPI000F669B07|nr:hypothetical protein [Agrobacterium sp. FDAARGOS_525]RSC31216.1 hypothetical protein EGT36_21310 [Agrobacterium sp. FDAARGOS_525]
MKRYRKQNAPDGTATFIKPLEIEIEPGKRVCDLPDLISCTHAIEKLAQEINYIAVQIDRAEASANKPPLEWFGKAVKAKRWKKRAMKAIRAHATFLRQTDPTHADAEEQRRENAELKRKLVEMETDGLYIAGFQAGWEAAVGEPRDNSGGATAPVDKSNNGENDG